MSIERLNLEFEDYRFQLESFILRMTASRQDTQDIVQETYLRAPKDRYLQGQGASKWKNAAKTTPGN